MTITKNTMILADDEFFDEDLLEIFGECDLEVDYEEILKDVEEQDAEEAYNRAMKGI